MIVPFKASDRPAGLHDTVARLNRPLGRQRVSARRFQEAIDDLLYRIENVYLLEFLLMDVIRLRRVPTRLFMPLCGTFETARLEILVGRERVVLAPVPYCRNNVLLMQMRSHRHVAAGLFSCDLGPEGRGWRLSRKEEGFRRLIEACLPERSVELTEALFRGVLNEALVGPQPILKVGSSDLRRGLSQLLDVVTSEPVRKSLAIGMRSSASEVGRQLSLAGPALKQSASRALPHVTRPVTLLLEARGAAGGGPAD